MAHTGIYATSAECIQKLGKNYNSTDVVEARINELCLQAEGLCNCAGRKVFATDAAAFAALSSDVKYILTMVVSNYVGMYGIMYDMSGFSSRAEAEDMINLLRDGMLAGLSILRDKKTQAFIDGAT